MLSPLRKSTGANRIAAHDCVLLVVDVQDKLLAAIPTGASLVANAAFMLDVAKLADVPAIATEQYPKGLGSTTPELASRLTAITAKTAFSCCGAEGFLDALRGLKRCTVVVVGMEAHVCVMQTVLDLLEADFAVVVPVDAVASRAALDARIALQRMKSTGAILSTVEAVGFEWIGGSTHPQFKAFSKLVIARS